MCRALVGRTPTPARVAAAKGPLVVHSETSSNAALSSLRKSPTGRASGSLDVGEKLARAPAGWHRGKMRLDLSKLTSEGLALEWPGVQREQRVALRGATNLRGSFISVANGWQLSNVACGQLRVDTLALHFGAIEIALEQGGSLDDVVADLGSSEGKLELEVEARTLETALLTLTTKSLHVTGRLEARQVKLRQRPGFGEITVEHAVLRDVALRTADLDLDGETIVIEKLTVQWGTDGLKVRAASAATAELVAKHVVTVARVFECQVEQLELSAGALRVHATHVERTELEWLVPRRRAAADPVSAPSEAPRPALFDYGLLDGLSGYLNVDVEMDMAVPIIGRRRATHKLRIPIAEGAINYRELEHDLASLEDSLLDFSVREGALVLERGVPLLSTRGRGKPLLIWPLGPADLALAQDRRVRLAVLPSVHVVSEGAEQRERSSSKLTLRTVSFEGIDAALSLDVPTPDASGVLRSLALTRLRVFGSVHHEAGAADPAGQLRAELDELDTQVAGLALGASRVSGGLALRALRNVEVDFEDLLPRQARGLLEGLTLREVVVALG